MISCEDAKKRGVKLGFIKLYDIMLPTIEYTDIQTNLPIQIMY